MNRILAGLLAIIGLWSGLLGRTITSNVPHTKIMDINLLDGNEFNMYISNYGKFGQSPQGSSGAWWPSSRQNETYIFGAGLWVGAVTKNGDTIVTLFYNPTYGQSEGVPAHIADTNDLYNYNASLNDPYDRVHIYGKTTEQGYDWPLKTVSGDDSVISYMDSYAAFMDIDPEHQDSGSSPLGLYVVEHTYQWNMPELENIVFFKYEIENISNDTLLDVYAGIIYDFDIGNESGTNANDLVGFCKTYTFPGDSSPVMLNLGYQYQTEPEPDWIGVDGNGLPGVIGGVFLESPLATDTVIVWDTIGTHVGPDTILPGEPLGMTAFKILIISIDPRDDPERYTIMSGYDPAATGGAYNPYMDDIYGPEDKRFIQVTGPFNLLPHQIVTFAVAVFVSNDTFSVFSDARRAVEFYNAGFSGVKENSESRIIEQTGLSVSYLIKDKLLTVTPLSNGVFRLFSVNGSVIRTEYMEGGHDYKISLEGVGSGIYYYNYVSQKRGVDRGKVLILK